MELPSDLICSGWPCDQVRNEQPYLIKLMTWIFWLPGGTGQPVYGSMRFASGIMAVCLVAFCATYAGNLMASLTGKMTWAQMCLQNSTMVQLSFGIEVIVWLESVKNLRCKGSIYPPFITNSEPPLNMYKVWSSL